jgi:hypothetical protein
MKEKDVAETIYYSNAQLRVISMRYAGSAGIPARIACASTLPQGCGSSIRKFALWRALMAGRDARAPRWEYIQSHSSIV